MEAPQTGITVRDLIPEIKISLTMSHNVKKSQLLKVGSSQDCADILRKLYCLQTFDFLEEFMILCLNQANKVVGFYPVSKGGITGTVADPRVILTAALNCAATSLVLSHNHPSGNLQPSNADKEITQKIKHAASYLDIRLLDHIILNDEGYFSFADEGLM